MPDALRQREPREHDSSYMGAIAKLPCCACLARGRIKYGVHVAHVRGLDREAGWREVGKQEKPDDVRTLPLCPSCHLNSRESQHNIGEPAFWGQFGIRPSVICLALKAAFDAHGAATMFAVMTREVHAARRRRQEALAYD